MDQAELPKHILPFQNIPLALASLGSLNAISFKKIKNTMLKGYIKIAKKCGTVVFNGTLIVLLLHSLGYHSVNCQLKLGVAQMNSCYIY